MLKIIDVNTCFGFDPVDDADLSLKTLLDMLRRNGVRKAFTFSRRGIHYHSHGNDETLAAVRKHSILEPVATLNPRDYFTCGEEMKIRIKQGFRLFRFFPDEQGWSIENFLPFSNLLEKLDKFKVAVMLPAMVGFGRISLIAEMMKRYSFSVIIETPPELAEIAAAMKSNKRLLFETHYFRTPMKLEKLIEEVGASQMVFGSGAPKFMLESTFNVVKNAEISDADKELIFSGNIEELLESLE